MSKVIVNNGQFKITIPKELALSKGWNKNTILRFIEDKDGNITLKEIKIR
jgi:bifunctional DNA-binding transcriptional regulator/antitoxin component of YhaV-PrlF toxin-antitoxin module|tara:strand:+ start:824 stop:973 length:150 start_codon:yes stop_codon:yes gene_type:complete